MGGGSHHHHKHRKDKKERKRDRSHDSGSEEERGHKSSKKSKNKHSRSGGGAPQGAPQQPPPEVQLTEEDYFSKVKELSVWLLEHKKKRFEELQSKDTHKQFAKFCKEWNAGRLEPEYYNGTLSAERITAATKTSHSWGFLKKMSERDKSLLASASNAIKTDTGSGGSGGGRGGGSTSALGGSGSAAAATGVARPTIAPRNDGGGGGGSAAARGGGLRQAYKSALDDVAPKETGRAALIDKRRTIGDTMHGAARDAEFQRDGLDLPEATTMGGGGDFHRHAARAKEVRERRGAAERDRLATASATEEAKRAAFMAQMGLAPGQRVTITPREQG